MGLNADLRLKAERLAAIRKWANIAWIPILHKYNLLFFQFKKKIFLKEKI
jgi:hypothetical protein